MMRLYHGSIVSIDSTLSVHSLPLTNSWRYERSAGGILEHERGHREGHDSPIDGGMWFVHAGCF